MKTEFLFYSICFGTGLLFTIVTALLGHLFGGHGADSGTDVGTGGHAEAGFEDTGMPGLSPWQRKQIWYSLVDGLMSAPVPVIPRTPASGPEGVPAPAVAAAIHNATGLWITQLPILPERIAAADRRRQAPRTRR